MDRANHYEAAFEAYLQEQRLGYVAVDETRRAVFGPGPTKSLDFIVYGEGEGEGEGASTIATARLVVDVKGRRYPAGSSTRPRHVWECWTAREDLDSLERWAAISGPGYRGLLVFMYHVLPSVELPANTPDVWDWRDRRYLLRAVPSAAYLRGMRQRSPRWQTVTLPQAFFRSVVRPLRLYTHPLRSASTAQCGS